MASVISVENVSKAYRLGMIGGATLKEDLSRWWAKRRGKADPLLKIGEEHHARRIGEEFWALQNVSFNVNEGEVLGIIGRNGAGKSTLLKILSQVTAPTSGQIKIKGRIASLLEVGTGFHPELTGRENIFLNGAILGMTKSEIRRKLDEIIDFSGIGEFIDTPVKRYSSGMYVRLAFAVAAHLEPEILIVDEVLAVGDAQFQKKCLGKMGDVAKIQGRTVLFVSHNMVAIRTLCQRAILLVDGRMQKDGAPAEVVPEYLETAGAEAPKRIWPDLQNAPGNDLVRLTGVSITAADRTFDGLIQMESPILIEVCCWRLATSGSFHLTLHLINQEEVVVLTTSPGCCPAAVGGYRSHCVIPANLLNSGSYRLKLLIVEDGSRGSWIEESFASFTVEDTRERKGGWMGREPSVLQIPLAWRTEPTAQAPETTTLASTVVPNR